MRILLMRNDLVASGGQYKNTDGWLLLYTIHNYPLYTGCTDYKKRKKYVTKIHISENYAISVRTMG